MASTTQPSELHALIAGLEELASRPITELARGLLELASELASLEEIARQARVAETEPLEIMRHALTEAHRAGARTALELVAVEIGRRFV